MASFTQKKRDGEGGGVGPRGTYQCSDLSVYVYDTFTVSWDPSAISTAYKQMIQNLAYLLSSIMGRRIQNFKCQIQ